MILSELSFLDLYLVGLFKLSLKNINSIKKKYIRKAHSRRNPHQKTQLCFPSYLTAGSFM